MLSQTLRGAEPLLLVLAQSAEGAGLVLHTVAMVFSQCLAIPNLTQHASLVKPSVIVPGQEGVQRRVAHASKDGGYSPVWEGDFPDLCVENECVECSGLTCWFLLLLPFYNSLF